MLAGKLSIELAAETVVLSAGSLFVVPRGAEHRPFSPGGASVLLLEPAGTLNRGSAGGSGTTAGKPL